MNLKYNNLSRSDILGIDPLFSRGKLENVIIDMIGQFKAGSGTDYANEELTKAAAAHSTTKT